MMLARKFTTKAPSWGPSRHQATVSVHLWFRQGSKRSRTQVEWSISQPNARQLPFRRPGHCLGFF